MSNYNQGQTWFGIVSLIVVIRLVSRPAETLGSRRPSTQSMGPDRPERPHHHRSAQIRTLGARLASFATMTFVAAGLAMTSCSTNTNTTHPAPQPTPTTPAETNETSRPTISTADQSNLAPATESQPPPDGLRPLVEGHNNLDADRINLIVSPWGWDDLEIFESVALMYIGWDQRAQLYNQDGLPTNDRSDAVGAELGLFGFEPFRSHSHVFNVWITDTAPSSPGGWIHATEQPPFDLADQVMLNLAKDPWDEIPGIASVAGQDLAFSSQQFPQRTGSDSVSDVMVAVSGSFPASQMRDVPHELGHALFGLADEYVGRLGGDGAPPREDFWPSCASSQSVAELWWADLVGQTDPMPAIWVAEQQAAGFPPNPEELGFLQDTVRIGYIDGGCHGDPGSVRAADNTMMGFNGVSFGLVNLRHAEAVLALWAG